MGWAPASTRDWLRNNRAPDQTDWAPFNRAPDQTDWLKNNRAPDQTDWTPSRVYGPARQRAAPSFPDPTPGTPVPTITSPRPSDPDWGLIHAQAVQAPPDPHDTGQEADYHLTIYKVENVLEGFFGQGATWQDFVKHIRDHAPEQGVTVTYVQVWKNSSFWNDEYIIRITGYGQASPWPLLAVGAIALILGLIFAVKPIVDDIRDVFVGTNTSPGLNKSIMNLTSPVVLGAAAVLAYVLIAKPGTKKG